MTHEITWDELGDWDERDFWLWLADDPYNTPEMLAAELAGIFGETEEWEMRCRRFLLAESGRIADLADEDPAPR